eukprot:2553237-Rhodomonas_salina.1
MEAAASWRRRRDLAANAGLDAANVATSSNPCCDATVCAQTAVQVVQLGGADSGVVRAANTQTIDLKHVCVDEKKLVQICKGALLSYACATRCPQSAARNTLTFAGTRSHRAQLPRSGTASQILPPPPLNPQPKPSTETLSPKPQSFSPKLRSYVDRD